MGFLCFIGPNTELQRAENIAVILYFTEFTACFVECEFYVHELYLQIMRKNRLYYPH